MPRRKRVYKNKERLKPDPKFGNLLLSKFVNHMMLDGKKSTAQRVVYDALDKVSEETKSDALEIFDTAIRNVSPVMEVKAKRVGGANYQVAIEVRGDRKETLAMRWIRDAVRGKKGKPMADRLAEEFMLAAKKEGLAMKKSDDVQRMAEANRAFSHFA
jgi:small subunit ribosomal protein S7